MNNCRLFWNAVLASAVAIAAVSDALAQSAVFTYQGRLDANGTAFTGSAEFQPTLWDSPGGGMQMAANNPATVIVSVTNGLFVLPLDFGTAPFASGAERYLQLQLRTAIGPFTTIAPRQRISSTPYAIQAANASIASTALTASSVNAANITGQLGLAQIPPTVLTNTQAGVNLAGSFTGNGGALTNLSTKSLAFTGTNVSLVSWGWNEYHQRDVPPNLEGVVSMSAGLAHNLAVISDGTVVAWGSGKTNDPGSAADRGQSIVPAGLNNVVAVSGGYLHSVAVRANGTVVAWGFNDLGQTNVPPGLNNVTAISAAFYHTLALRADGTVIAWGTNHAGLLDVPPGLNDAKAISAGLNHNLVLRSNGTVVVWGTNEYGVLNVPPGLNNVVAISAGATHNAVLRNDGSIVMWGTNDYGQLNVPAGLTNVVTLSAGLQQTAALKADGTVVAWGYNAYGQTNVPPGLNNVVYLAPGFAYHYLALRRRSDAPVAWLDSDNTFNGNIQVNGDLRASGEISAGAGLRLYDGNLWLRGSGDFKNGLGWYGPDKSFAYGTPSGPVLFGDSGGALGTYGTNGYHVALTWDTQERVTIGQNSDTSALLFTSYGGTHGIKASSSQLRFFVSGFGGTRFSFTDGENGSDLFTIQPSFGSANVGIGTGSPNGRLDVRGEIRFGPSGQYSVPAVIEGVRIIRGVISAAGSILSGTGFSVTKTATGAYTVNFSNGFYDLPAVTATVQSGLSRVVTCTSVSSSSAQFRTFVSSSEAAADLQFHFIAIGSR